MICPACNSKYDEALAFCPKDGTALVPDDTQTVTRVGQILADRYRIVSMLGEGGMGEVYEAEHIYIKKKVALKLLRNEITSNAEAVTRFHQEALAASTIGHDNIVVIDDFGRLPDGSVYLTMEYLDGEPLSDVMLKGPLTPDRALTIVIQMCEGLAAAHSKGIVHRDMKPENVYMVASKDGTELAKILDFGIAKVSTSDSGENLTRTGTIFGTPHYMSPEQAMGRQLDHRTDIYSVGVIMYELFTGTVPFKAESFMGILTQHITALPQPPRTCAPDRNIHPEIERVILTAMAKEPENRYPSMVEFLEDIKNVRRTVTGFQPAVAAPGPTGAMPTAGSGGWGTTSGMQSTVPSGQFGPPTGTPMPVVTGTPMPMAPGTGVLGPTPANPAAHVSSTRLPPGQVPISASSGRGAGKVVAIVAAVLLVLGGGAAAAWFLVLDKGSEGEGGSADTGAAVADKGDAGVQDAGGAEPDAAAAVAEKPDATEPDVMERRAVALPDPRPGTPEARTMAPEPRRRPRRASPVAIELRSRPRGAAVYAGSRRACGPTPCKVTLPPGGSRTYTIKRRGYKPLTVTVRTRDGRVQTFALSRIRVPVAVMHRPMHRPVMRPPPMRRAFDPFSEGID